MRQSEYGCKLCDYVRSSDGVRLVIKDNNSFNIETCVLSLSSESCSQIQVVAEEFAHIAAYFCCGEGADGNCVNLEFEAKVIADLVYSEQSEFMDFIVTFGCDGEMVLKYENFIKNRILTDYEYQRFQQWWYERQVESGTWYGSLPYDANAECVLFKQLMEGK